MTQMIDTAMNDYSNLETSLLLLLASFLLAGFFGCFGLLSDYLGGGVQSLFAVNFSGSDAAVGDALFEHDSGD